eukprot:299636_1
MRNKYRNGTYNDEYSQRNRRAQRQRPELHTNEQQLQYKQQLRDQSKNHLDEALRFGYEAEEIGADTSEKLYNQRKQLENVDKMLHETDQNLDRTEHTLKGMKSIWGGIGNWFVKPPEAQQYQKRVSAPKYRDDDDNNNNKKNSKMNGYQKQQQKYVDNKYGIKNRPKMGDDQSDDEFNDKLDELHKSVKRMKMMAQNINYELEDQGDLLDNIDDNMG